MTPKQRLLIVVVLCTLGLLSTGTAYAGDGHVNGSDHYSGRARDVMVHSRSEGDRVAACALGMSGMKYVIWDQQISFGEGWRGMDDRGGRTANHEDHVHISFYSRDAARSGRCG